MQGLDLGGIGRMIAMTPNDEVNSIAAHGVPRAVRQRERVPAGPAKENERATPPHPATPARPVCSSARDVTYDELRRRVRGRRGSSRRLRFSEDFTIADFVQEVRRHGAGLVHFPRTGPRADRRRKTNPLEPQSRACKILALVDPPEERLQTPGRVAILR